MEQIIWLKKESAVLNNHCLILFHTEYNDQAVILILGLVEPAISANSCIWLIVIYLP